MTSTSLRELIDCHAVLSRADDPPVQVVVNPENIHRLVSESQSAHPFKINGKGGYIAFGLPVYLDFDCAGAVVMGRAQTKVWEERWREGRIFRALTRR